MQRRKDNKVKDGEVYHKSDGLYMYRWTAKNGKRHTIYDATLEGLREKEEKIQHDLAEGIRIPECSLTLPQQQAFLNFIKKTPKFQHWLPMFTFMLGTGCCISETVGLCWSDIDFESGFITIQHNLVYHDHEVGGCFFTMSTPKTAAGKRAIPKNPQTVNRAIKRISVAYNEAELEKAEKEKREPQLPPPFSCHNLRHTFCTRLCENETNLKIIQDIMGHKDNQHYDGDLRGSHQGSQSPFLCKSER